MRRMVAILGLSLATACVAAVGDAQTITLRFDTIIENGRILDGSGNPAIVADIGIRGDTIAAIGKLRGARADRVIDASGLYVTPGFIDMHSHADGAFAGQDRARREAPNLVTQGITTLVFGADGRNTRWPIAAEIEAFRSNGGTALNIIPMVGHGTIRGRVMGDDFQRPATADEVDRMKALMRQGMDEGAWGIGAGTEYSPGIWSTTAELIALCEVVAEFDGFYYAHQRSQSILPRWQLPSQIDGPTLDGVAGLAETIELARATGIRTVGSHVKAKGRASWGRAFIDTRMVADARAEGLQVYFDHYPYETFNGGAGAIFPAWALQGGREELLIRLDDPETRARLIMDLEHVIDIHGGPGRLIITSHVDESLIGKTVRDVARQRGQSMVDTLIEFALEGTRRMRAGHLVRPMGMSEADNDQYIRQDYTATSTDGGVTVEPGGPPGRHPRYWGAFPRKIAHYVKDRGVITLPFAIRSMTSLGAQIIGLPDRGRLLTGYKADITIFSFEEIRDRATVMEPGLPSEGIHYVMVNGDLLMDDEALTGALPGRVLNRKDVRGF